MRIVALLAAASSLLPAQDSPATPTAVTPPQITPEATQYERTSTAVEVAQFLTKLSSLPHGDRLRISVAGTSTEGRNLLLVRAALPDIDEPKALRALIIANIHAGEVEGKEAVQELLREVALGQHEDLLHHSVLYVLPIYNIDGNERFDLKNRTEQNGPDSVGQRPNAQDFDLNRDFVKAEATETRVLLQLFARLDPHLFFDLHTTDGSWHGYHLTYAPCLSPNQDHDLATLSRSLLDAATATLQAGTPSYQTFDYGNFETRDWDGGGAPESQAGVRGWWSYDHRARYGINYFGLRNRIGILSEAYSNCDFATRIAATRAFVLAVLTAATARADEVRKLCDLADRRLQAVTPPQFFGFDTTFGAAETLAVLVGDCDRFPHADGRGTRFARKDTATPETMPVHRRFCARQQIALPTAWALPAPPVAVVELLQRHGLQTIVLDAARTATAERFHVAQKRKPKRPFQGHQELQLDGAWSPAGNVQLPPGTLWIPGHQQLARLAAELLEATSEDSISTWNFLEAVTGDDYPVLRIVGD